MTRHGVSARPRADSPRRTLPRVIGEVGGAEAGPVLVAVAGLHGNEFAGITAARRVLESLSPGSVRGRFVAVAGNLEALERGRRFLDRDLNRRWRVSQVQRLRARGPDPRIHEDTEQLALLQQLDLALAGPGPVHLVDLHTTSGDSPPFTTFGDTLANRTFARSLPLPVVLGLEEQVGGTLLEYVDSLGHTAIAIEGGRHGDPRSADHLTAALQLCLAYCGLVDPAWGPAREARLRLESVAERLPPVVEMRHRHPVGPRERFEMEPGYGSFVPVREGEVVARTDGREVRVRESGRMLMPRYQPQGTDGFFIVRDVRPLWLAVSRLLRRLGAHRLTPLLPGVRPHPRLANGLVVDLRVARWLGTELFHLLGYRRRRRVGPVLVLVRRTGI